MNPVYRLTFNSKMATIAAVAVLSALSATPTAVVAQEGGRNAQVLPSGGRLPPPQVPGSGTPAIAPRAPANNAPTPPAAAAQQPQGQTQPANSVTGLPPDVEEVVSWKTNFEQDARCRPLPLNAKIRLDFEEAPLKDVVKFIACITQRNFMIPPSFAQGKTVTILSTTDVTVYEAYKAFLATLDSNGLTIIPSGAFYKIVETAKARTEVVPIYGADDTVPAEDRLVTRIVALKYIEVNDVAQVLGKFKTAAGDISVYQPGNSLIITDLGSNIVRMLKFLAELDLPTGREKIWVRPVQYASASEMATLITSVFGERQSTGGTARRPAAAAAAAAAGAPGGDESANSPEGATIVSKVIADERTNQLIIVATPAAYLKIDRLLRRMDMPIEGEGQIHIYYLENANAEDVASTLSSLASSSGSRGRTGRGATAPAAGGAAPSGGSSGGAASLFSGEVRITAHKPTNSLVIESTLKDYISIKRVIQQLDVRRKQVYVEAVIMEISSNKNRNLGISGSVGSALNIGGESVPLLMGLGGLGMSGLDLTQLTSGGMALGMQGPLVSVDTGSTSSTGTLSIPAYGFAIQALQSNSDVNVLSTPHILTMDNEEAEIVVGKQIPYQASSGSGLSSLLGNSGLSSSTTSSTLSSLTSSLGYGSYVQRIDVDMTLKITPQISESNFVRLQIEQQLDDVESMDATLGPTTSKRKVTNVVVVRDQQPVVIGGLIRDVESSAVDKVPLLGDIPVLGALFRRTVRTIEKRNLLMIIIPYIIEDPSDLQRIHDQKMEEMREFAEYMATRRQEYEGGVDYRRKTGLLEDMRRTMEEVRREREMMEQTGFDNVDLVGRPESHDLDFDPLSLMPAGQPAAAGSGAGSTSPGAAAPASSAPQTHAAPATPPATQVAPAGERAPAPAPVIGNDAGTVGSPEEQDSMVPVIE